MCSEFDIIHRYFKRTATGAVLGIGDDAALITSTTGIELAISTDTLVCGKHFFPDADPYKLGHKSLAVNLSDMAAMGAKPRWALLTLTIPNDLVNQNTAWISKFSDGFFALADSYQIELIGGDTTAGPLNIGIQIIGEIAAGKALRRSGAKLGDDIWISGQIGDAALALQHELRNFTLKSTEIEQCLPALLTPTARVKLGQHLIGLTHSAIDISDGLMADLGHILTASEKAAYINIIDIPCSPVLKKYQQQSVAMNCLLAGGDDYELCFTAPKINRPKIETLAAELAIQLTRIGEIYSGEGLIVKDEQGNTMTFDTQGYDHFRN
ncbi:thiamine-phosphate kinase [Nitrosomonas supralitoralis]|uniref:Thiamine-monophosphate kinase n=1 Tax=Nitrosomonas supralitoralis TaxID=2116706 RepID=A0A2P7NXX5_9PROT|nr:thiamine-phosphate kinase [Nitrosomonas supralitoralis]PSJ18311.1 thiamine-phosphate kinase [Nitrosomonas supralitoralis]